MRLTTREKDIFTVLIDTSVAPVKPLPPIAQTDAVEAFTEYLEASPKQNRIGLRVALRTIDIAPYLVGYRKRFRALSPSDRLDYLRRLAKTPLYLLVKMITGLAKVFYYGDVNVMKVIGYDADAKLAAGRKVRQEDGRW